MWLQAPTIRKLMRECFPGGTPLHVPPAKQQETAADFTARLKRLHRVELDHRQYGWDSETTTLCSFVLLSGNASEDRSYYYRRPFFSLRIDKQRHVRIITWTNQLSAAVSRFEEVEHFIGRCLERMDHRETKHAKRQTVRNLKTQAIVAAVKQLAKECGFDFFTQEDNVRLHLYVQFAQEQCFVLYIPFARFQEVLPGLRDSIQFLRQLATLGIEFYAQPRGPRRWMQAHWIRHESL